MKLLVKFKVEPTLDEAFKTMQKVLDYVNELEFVDRIEEKINTQLEVLSKGHNIQCCCPEEYEEDYDDIGEGYESPLCICPCMIRDELKNSLYEFVDINKRKFSFMSGGIQAGVKLLSEAIFDPEVWKELGDKELRSKVVSWCKKIQKMQDSIELNARVINRKYIELPEKAYDDGYFSVLVDINMIPRAGELDEYLILDKGMDIIYAKFEDDGVNFINLVEESGIEYDMRRMICELGNIIHRFGASQNIISEKHDIINQICLVNESGDTLKELNFSEEVNDNHDITAIKFMVPGGKSRYDLNIEMDIIDIRAFYNVDVQMEVREELRDTLEGYSRFVNHGVKAGVISKVEESRYVDWMNYMNIALIRKYTPEEILIDTICPILFVDGLDSKAEAFDELSDQDNYIKKLAGTDYILAGVDRSLLADIIMCNVEKNEVSNGFWKFRGTSKGTSKKCLEEWIEKIQHSVGKSPAEIKIERL